MNTTQPTFPGLFFITYAKDAVTTVRNQVTGIHCQVYKNRMNDQFLFSFTVRYTRPDGTEGSFHTDGERPQRKRAIETMRGLLHDHFNKVPTGTMLRIETGEPIPFPESSARPYAKAS